MHVRYRLCAVAIALLATYVPPLAARETIQVGRPTLSTPSRETERFLDEQFTRAIALAELRTEGLRVGYTGFATGSSVRQPTITVEVVAVREAGTSMLVLNATSRSGRSESYPYMLPWGDRLHADIAAILCFFAGVLGDRPPPAGRPPVYFQEFVTDFISTADTPHNTAVYPFAVSGTADSLFVAAGSTIVEVDRYFRELGKTGVDMGLAGTWAYHLAVSPAGTVVAASAAQAGLVRIVPDLPLPIRVPTPSAVQSLAVTADGTAFTVDMQQAFRGYSTEGVRQLDLGLPPGTWISVMAAGPDNTLLVWEPMHRAVFVYDAQGGRVDTIIPHMPMDEGMRLRHLSVYPNGDLLLVLNDGLRRFDRAGRLVWRVDNAELPEVGQLAFYTSVGASPSLGLINLVNVSERKVVQLLDLHELAGTRALDGTERAILDLNARLRSNPLDQRLLAERARVYEGIEAWELAAHVWDVAYGLNPMNRDVARSREQVELRRARADAARLAERAIGLLESFGRATAALVFQNAQVALERVLSIDPDDREARAALEELRSRFETATQPGRRPPSLEVIDVRLDDLFPGMIEVYRTQPVGTVRLRNQATSEVTNVTVTSEMPGFLEFPVESARAASIGAGESVDLPLTLPLSVAALSLEETRPAAVRITVKYEQAGRVGEVSRTEIATVHRATALTWDDAAKLASYITPRDGVVERFAAAFVSTGEAARLSLSQHVFRAAHVVSGLAAHGVRYVEDPQSGITQVLGDAFAIDTVRFPRTTLRVRAGDCDDTTALLASLLEAVGIGTAIMTSPGHVFLAFDTGEPASNAWLFESETTAAIGHAGTVWLPFETTTLDRGFLASWQEGSRLYRVYSGRGEMEFLPTADQRELYPPLPLDPASYDVPPPPASLVGPLYTAASAGVTQTIYTGNVASLERRIQGSDDRQRARLLNQVGILHGRFAKPAAAERSFREVLRIDPDNSAAYLNLANLELLAGNGREALRFLDEAERRRPGGLLATLLRAQALYLTGDRSAAGRQMAIVLERAPELAAQYPHLAGGASERASEARAGVALPWAYGADGE